jgi:hypothetical protein
MQPKPSIGRIVHYFNDSGEPEAAIVIHVHNDENVNLIVCNQWGTWTSRTSVQLGEGAGHWNWPTRV